MRVVCIRRGGKYPDHYVKRLKAMVEKNLQLDHDFVCFTDKDIEGITCKPLPSDLPGWWSKIGLFKDFVPETLYLDLTHVITGDLSIFRRDDDKVWALDDFSYSLRTPKGSVDPETRRLLGGVGTCNSSVMWWRGDAGKKVWDSFTSDVMNRLHGDQNFITETLWPDCLSLYPPGLVCSYKYHVQRGEQHGSIVKFHGQPKMHELPSEDPLRKIWEAA